MNRFRSSKVWDEIFILDLICWEDLICVGEKSWFKIVMIRFFWVSGYIYVNGLINENFFLFIWDYIVYMILSIFCGYGCSFFFFLSIDSCRSFMNKNLCKKKGLWNKNGL